MDLMGAQGVRDVAVARAQPVLVVIPKLVSVTASPV